MSNRFCWFEIFGLSVGFLHRSQEEKKRERSEREKERKFWIQRKKKIQEVNTVMTLNARTKWPLEVSWLQIEEDTGRQIKREKERRKRTEISCVCVCHCVYVCVCGSVCGWRATVVAGQCQSNFLCCTASLSLVSIQQTYFPMENPAQKMIQPRPPQWWCHSQAAPRGAAGLYSNHLVMVR